MFLALTMLNVLLVGIWFFFYDFDFLIFQCGVEQSSVQLRSVTAFSFFGLLEAGLNICMYVFRSIKSLTRTVFHHFETQRFYDQTSARNDHQLVDSYGQIQSWLIRTRCRYIELHIELCCQWVGPFLRSEITRIKVPVNGGVFSCVNGRGTRASRRAVDHL